MHVWVRLGYLAGTTLAVCALAASASAAVSPAQPPTAGIEVKGSNGYRIWATVNDLGAQLTAEEEEAFGNSVEYQASPGRSGNDKFSAKFGKLGMISVHFEPSGKVRRSKVIGCRGAEQTIRFGTFDGTMRFRGENGYTEFRARRVTGKVSSAPRQVCHPSKSPPTGKRQNGNEGSGEPLITTAISASSALTDVWFQAERLEDESHRNEGLAAFAAYAYEAREGMKIRRHAGVAARAAGVYNLDQARESASIAPPIPFSGTASFQQNGPYTSRWEGPLTVSFPGRPEVPLTGRDFASSLSTAPADDRAFAFPFPGLNP